MYLEAPPAPPSVGVGQSLTPAQEELAAGLSGCEGDRWCGKWHGLFLARASQGKVQEAEKLNQIPAEDAVPVMGQMAMC